MIPTPTIARLQVLIVLLALGGCAASSSSSSPELEATLVGATTPPGGLTPVFNGDGLVAGFYALGAVVLAVGFLVDLVLLPFSAEHPDLFFPCCKELLRLAD